MGPFGDEAPAVEFGTGDDTVIVDEAVFITPVPLAFRIILGVKSAFMLALFMLILRLALPLPRPVLLSSRRFDRLSLFEITMDAFRCCSLPDNVAAHFDTFRLFSFNVL